MWYTYILNCSDNTLYTGVTNDLEKRIIVHNKGTGAKYTKMRLPVSLLYSETFENRSEAQKREYQIKQFSRLEKLQLIHNQS